MNEFMMIFRMDYKPNFKPSTKQIQDNIKQWQDWIGGIASNGKLVGTNRLGFQGKTLKSNKVIIEGPYAELKETVSGYIMVKADDLNQAFEMANGCPILNAGGSVEVRAIIQIPK
ncbi:YciI family protein [Winogradskyella flava]|uniref:YciI family protein n=1 Tax=Winogradskyella flava TaxID=1884876 RepID=UPI002491BACB|nr:YciI family protein [Winogradskyella flava]